MEAMKTISRGRKSEMNMFMKWITLLLSVVTLGLSGCGESDKFYGSTGGSVTPGANNTVSVAALQSSIVVGTTTQITALLVDGDEVPVEGGTITFLADNGSFAGGLKTTTATTNASGLATVSLTAPVKVGTGSIDAQYAESSASVSMNYIVGAINQIYLDASPGAVGVSSPSTLTALVIDAYGNPLVNEAMQFTVSANNSGSPGIELGGIIQTNASGIATATYNSGTTVGVADTVTVGQLINPTITATKNISVLASATTISSLKLALSSASTAITVGTNSASINPVSVDATVLDDTGSAVEGISVSFQLVGTGDFGGVKSKTALTDVNGIASVLLDAPILIGSASITAATAGITASTSVTYIPDVPNSITLSASPVTVGVSTDSTLTVGLFDQYGNVTPNEPVFFDVTANNSVGASLSNPTGNAQTDNSGVATMTYTSGTTTGVIDTVQVTALNGTTPSTTADISVSAAATSIASLDLALSTPTTSITVGTNTVTADATVLDNLGAPIAGVSVAFQIDGTGDLSGSKVITVPTGVTGVASATLNAPILVGSATITVATAGKSSSVNVNYIPDAPDNITLSVSPATVGVSSDSTLTAALYDQYGNIAANEAVTFTIETNNSVGALLSNPTGNAQTNTNGVATMIYTSGTNTGVIDTVRVTALNGTAPSITAGISVSAAATSVATLDLALDSPTTSITVGTNSSSPIPVKAEATVLDNLGAPVDGVVVAFEIIGAGDFSGAKIATATTSLGVASVTLNASQLIGSASIIATAAGLSSTVVVNYIPDVPASVSISASPASVGVSSDSTLAATVYDQFGNVIADEPVVFSVGGSNDSSFGFTPSTGIAVTNSNGVATMLYTSGTGGVGTDTVVVTSSNVVAANDSVDITVLSGLVPSQMIIRTDATTILSDNSTVATLTLTVLDGGNVVVPNTTVNFAADGGVLSVGAANTDVNGEARVTLSAGTDPTNQNIIVTANSGSLTDVIIPIEVVGSTVTITATRDVLVTDGLNASTLTVRVADASGTGVYNVPVNLSVDNGAIASLNPVTGFTGVSGEFTSTLTGTANGTVTVTASALNAQAEYVFTVSTTADSLLITDPPRDPVASVALNTPKDITVSIPDGVATVTLVSTIGTWDKDGNVSNVTTIANPALFVGAETVTTQLTSTQVGTATVRATDITDTAITDEIQLVFVDETVDATSMIALQASPTTVAPSIGSTLNSSLLEVDVRNGAGIGVANARVVFSVSNSTGSGEYVYPAVAYTDSSGLATATFYSGSQSSGAGGVTVTAALDESLTGSLVSDSRAIIVNGTAGSINIAQSTTVSTIYSNTMYALPMTLLVTDSGGNPVANTDVTLSLWPEKYGIGFWFCEPEPGVWVASILANEDVDRDLQLSGGEDKSGDGALTPANSAAGGIPSIVTTDDSGVASFELQYPKESAGFIYNAVSATTLVQGTETRATKRFWLGAAESDITGCYLGSSPFNPSWPELSAVPDISTVLVSGSTTVTVTVVNPDGAPRGGELISAQLLVEGTDSTVPPTLVAASLGSDTTNGSGVATFTYTAGDQAGSDELMFYFILNGAVLSDYITMTAE